MSNYSFQKRSTPQGGAFDATPDLVQPGAACHQGTADLHAAPWPWKLVSAIATAPDINTALDELLKTVCELTGWDLGEVWMPNPEGTHLTCTPHWYTSQPLRCRPFRQVTESMICLRGAGIPGQVWVNGQAVWVPDIASQQTDGLMRREAALAAGFATGWGVPLWAGDRLWAVLVFFAFTAQPTDQIWVTDLATLLPQIGSLLPLKQTESELRDSQCQLQRLINSLPGIVFAAGNDRDWSMIYLSDGCSALTGYASDELVGPNRPITYNEITLAEDLPTVIAIIDQAIASHKPYVAEYRIRTKSGTEKWLWEKGYGVYDDQGQVLGLEGFITDITGRKQAEEALRQSEAQYRDLLNALPEMLFLLDETGTYLYAQAEQADDLPLPIDQLIGKPLDEVLPADVAAIAQTAMTRVRQTHQCQTFEYQLHLQGTTRYFDARLASCGDHRFIITVRNITERKWAERAIQEKEAFLRLILDNIPQYIFWKDQNCVYRGANRIFAEAAGFTSPDDIIGKTDYDLWLPDQANSYQNSDRMVMETDKPMLHLIRSKVQSGDQMIWQDVSKVPIHDTDGNVIGLLGTYEDITSRRKAEEALAKREEYLATLVELQRQLLTFSTRTEIYTALVTLLGAVSQASRVYIFENTRDDQGRRVMSLAQTWCRDNMPALKHNPLYHNLTYDTFSSEFEAILAQGDIYTKIWDEFTESERALLHPDGVCSFLVLPLIVSGQFFGFIGFDHCGPAQRWEASDIDLLRAATAGLSLALERLQAIEQLQAAESKYRGIFENAVEGIFQSTPEGNYITANPMLARLYGYDSPAELTATLTDIQHQLYVDRQRRDEFVRQMQTHGAVFGFESQVYRKDGSVIWISECARTVFGPTGEVVGYEGTVEDITHRKQAEAELLKRDNLLQGVADATQCLLTNTDLNAAIPQALAILGQATRVDRVYIYEHHPHPLTGEIAMTMRYEWVAHEVKPSIHQVHWQNQCYETAGLSRWYAAFSVGEAIGGIVRLLPVAEQKLLQRDEIVSIIMVPIFVEEELWGYIGFDDCHTERVWSSSEESILVAIAASIGGAIKRQRTEEQMRYQAFHDSLTALPNRMAYNHQLYLTLSNAQRSGEMFGVMFLDLDRFKTINDTLGHTVGDQILQQATQRLTMCLRDEDTIARWGGDEFILLLPNLKSLNDAAKIAHRISDALKPVFWVDGHELRVTCSVGIATYPHNGSDAQTLLKNADAALYRAKEQGRNTYEFYDARINSEASERLTLDNSLHNALDRHEFVVHYQPQINVKTGQITQMEALVRWQHPQLGLVPPQTFITLAEENGLIVPIGEWVLRTACAQNKRWQEAGLGPVRVAVNLSARQFQQPDLAETIALILQTEGLSAHCLELEITETAAMRDLNFTTGLLCELRAMGVRIAMDDFGTGYSSLSYLKKFPLHALKIDRTFVQDLMENPDDAAIIKAIIALGQGLNLSVVAEGVETAEQVERLRSLHCHEMQGYFLSPPLNAEAATEFLRQHGTTHFS